MLAAMARTAFPFAPQITQYYYTWDRVNAKTHQNLAWLYAGSSYFSWSSSTVFCHSC